MAELVLLYLLWSLVGAVCTGVAARMASAPTWPFLD